MKIIAEKKIVIVKNNIAIRIAGKVSQYIDASMNRATPTINICDVNYNCAVHSMRGLRLAHTSGYKRLRPRL